MAIFDYSNRSSTPPPLEEPRYSALAIAAAAVGVILVPINCSALFFTVPKDLLSPPAWHYVLWYGDYLTFAIAPGLLGAIAIFRIRRANGRLTGEYIAAIGILASSCLLLPVFIKLFQTFM